MKTIDTYITERLKLNKDTKVDSPKIEKIGFEKFIKLINGNTDFGKFEKAYEKHEGKCYKVPTSKYDYEKYAFILKVYNDGDLLVVKIEEEIDDKLSITMRKVNCDFTSMGIFGTLNKGRPCYLKQEIMNEFIYVMNYLKNNCNYWKEMEKTFETYDDEWLKKKYYIDE